MKTLLCINAWYGRGEHEVVIVKETAKRYLVRCVVEGTLFPGGRHLAVGEETYVPKYAIKHICECASCYTVQHCIDDGEAYICADQVACKTRCGESRS